MSIPASVWYAAICTFIFMLGYAGLCGALFMAIHKMWVATLFTILAVYIIVLAPYCWVTMFDDVPERMMILSGALVSLFCAACGWLIIGTACVLRYLHSTFPCLQHQK